jgi:translocation and assembly module TamB
LLTGLDIDYLDYQVSDKGALQQQYRAENLSFRWQPLTLFYNAVSVQSLRADAVRILLPPAVDVEPEPAPWPSLALPVIVELGQVEVRDIQVRRSRLDAPPEEVITLQRVSGSLRSGVFNLRAADLAVVTDEYTVIAQGRIGLRYPYDADIAVQWQYEIPPTEDQETLLLSGRGEITGDIEQLEITHQLRLPFDVESHVTLVPNLSQPPAAIAALAAPQITAVSQWPAQPLLSQWFPADADIPIVAGQLWLEGWLDDYRAQLSGQINYATLPPLTVSAATRGDLQRLDIAELVVGVAPVQPAAGKRGAAANISGQVAWAPNLHWDLTVATEGLDPALYVPEWPGQLQLGAKTQGQLTSEGLRVTVEELQLDGQIRALDVRGVGGVQFDGERWQTDNLSLSLGANHLRVNGTLGDNFDVQWYLNAPLLNQIDPGLQGTFFTQGHLQGNWREPQLVMEMRAQQLRWQDLGLEHLVLELMPLPEGNYQLKLDARDLLLQQQRIDSLAFTGSGTIAQSHLNGRIVSPLGELELALDSGYRDQSWQGQFTALDVDLNNLPRWQLLRSSPMHAQAQGFELGELCLTTRTAWRRGGERRSAENEERTNAGDAAAQGEKTEPTGEIAAELAANAQEEVPALCAQGQWSTERGLLMNASLTAIPLHQLRAFLDPDVGIAGVLAGEIAVQLPPGGAPTASIDLYTDGGELRYQYADEPVESYRWETLAIQGNLRDSIFQAQLNNRWGEYGAVLGDVALNIDTGALSGGVRIDFTDLAPLAALVPMVDDLGGNLAADIDLGGSLEQPQVLGQISLSNGAAKIPRLGLDVRDIGLTLNSYSGGRIELRSRLHSGEGFLQIDGELEGLGSPDWQLHGAMRGEQFLIIQQPEVQAHIEPAIQLRARQQAIEVTGETLIPFARVELKALPATATKVSDDVVILEAGEVPGLKDKMDFYLNVKARLGDDVRFNGFGLSSRVAGEMTLTQTPARPMLATGYVDVVDGKYKAYGQELDIERGRLIFQGPLDNPGLEIRAQRTLRGTTDSIVGLEIGGTLQRPTSSVYSDPPLNNEGEAMALLLTGKPLSEASAGDAYTIISAMSGLGMDEGGSITAQIADTFHLDEFALSAEDGLAHSSLMVGKYLTERLFVRYVVGLFDEFSKIGLVYQMTDRLRLEAESGDVQSVDMIYKIER